MTKRAVALILALLMLVSLAACSAGEDTALADSAGLGAAVQDSQDSQDSTAASATEAAPTPAQSGREPRVTPLGDGKDQVTVMVYMCGSDLESDGGAATADLN